MNERTRTKKAKNKRRKGERTRTKDWVKLRLQTHLLVLVAAGSTHVAVEHHIGRHCQRQLGPRCTIGGVRSVRRSMSARVSETERVRDRE